MIAKTQKSIYFVCSSFISIKTKNNNKKSKQNIDHQSSPIHTTLNEKLDHLNDCRGLKMVLIKYVHSMTDLMSFAWLKRIEFLQIHFKPGQKLPQIQSKKGKSLTFAKKKSKMYIFLHQHLTYTKTTLAYKIQRRSLGSLKKG